MAEKKKRPIEDDYLGALAWWIVALGLSEDEIRDAKARAKREGETVAAHAEAVAVLALWSRSEALEAKGVPFAEGKAQIAGVLSAWTAEPTRVEMMANLATQVPYQRGRWMELRRKPGRMLRYNSALEPRTCDYCRGLHGTVLPEGHPWWTTHWPPAHARCLCTVTVADGDPTLNPPEVDPKPGFGQPPGSEFAPDWTEFPGPIAATAAMKKP